MKIVKTGKANIVYSCGVCSLSGYLDTIKDHILVHNKEWGKLSAKLGALEDSIYNLKDSRDRIKDIVRWELKSVAKEIRLKVLSVIPDVDNEIDTLKEEVKNINVRLRGLEAEILGSIVIVNADEIKPKQNKKSKKSKTIAAPKKASNS